MSGPVTSTTGGSTKPRPMCSANVTALPPRPVAPSREESGALRRLDLPRDELAIVALLVSYPALAKFAQADVIGALAHPGLAAVARVLVDAIRDRPRSRPDRVSALALQDAPRSLRVAVCEAALALGEVRHPHEALVVAADALGACSRCRSRSWQLALTTATGRICKSCIKRGRSVRIRLPEPPIHGRNWPLSGGVA